MLNIDPHLMIVLLYASLILASCFFGYYTSLNPPKQENNPFAVFAGIVMVLMFLQPSLIISHRLENELLIAIIPALFPISALGISGTMWVLRHRIEKITEELASIAYAKLRGVVRNQEE